MREQLLQQHKKLIELQQEKLKLELLQTQAQLEEQQKMLEKQTGHFKTFSEKPQQKKGLADDNKKAQSRHSSELSSSTQKSTHRTLNKEEDRNKSGGKRTNNLSSQIALRPEAKVSISTKPDITGIPPASRLESQKASDILLKPYATAELNTSPLQSKKAMHKTSKTISPKSENLLKSRFQDTSEPAYPAPHTTRIAPVSSQLINAARRTRDPRILRRQMEEPQQEPSVSPNTSLKKSFSLKESPSEKEHSSKIRNKTANEDTKAKSEQSKLKDSVGKPFSQSLKSKLKKDRKSSKHSKDVRRIYDTVQDIKNKKSQMQETIQFLGKSNTSSLSKSNVLPLDENLYKSASKTKLVPDNSDKVELLHSKPALEKKAKNENNDLNVKNSIAVNIEVSQASYDSHQSYDLCNNDKKLIDKIEQKPSSHQILTNRNDNQSSFLPSRNKDEVSDTEVSEGKKEFRETVLNIADQTKTNSSIPVKNTIIEYENLDILSSDQKFKNQKSAYKEENIITTESAVVSSPVSEILPDKKTKNEKSDQKTKVIQQILSSREVDEASPSPPPPPVISDKFKEVKPSSLSRLRKYVRNREGSESPPISGDIDLRHSLNPQIDDEKKENVDSAVISTEKDIDLRRFPLSPTKKRPSIERSDAPPSKKSKAEVLDELFGKEDVDLRTMLPPSPPPPPVISLSSPSIPEDMNNGTEITWAKYKQQKPDTFKTSHKFTPLKSPSFKRGHGNQQSWRARGKHHPYRDTDMRHDFDSGGHYDVIIKQAHEQYNSGSLTDNDYKKIVTEVISMHEIRQVEEAQRLDEELLKDEDYEELEPISDDEMSSYSGNDVKKRVEGSCQMDNVEEKGESPNKIYDKRRYNESDKPGFKKPRQYIDNSFDRTHQDVSHLKGSNTTDIQNIDRELYNRDWERREDFRQSRQEHKLQRRVESGRMFRKSRFGQMDSSEVWDPPTYENRDEENLIPPQEEPHQTPWESMRPPASWIRNIPPLMHVKPALMPRFGGNRWRPPLPMAPPRPIFEGDNQRYNRYIPPLSSGPGELPPADPKVLEMIANDPTQNISIDNRETAIRFYGDIAVGMMAWDDPREISFQSGQRRIIIDDRDSMLLSFNAPPIEMIIDGQPHRVKFGSPTRELYIDFKWYEIYFGGPKVSIEIAGKMHSVQLEGPAPPVRKGMQRKDLVVGRIKLIIDAIHSYDIYLDPKPQRFDIEGTPIIVRFVEALQTVVINGVPFKSDFGGLPKPLFLKGKKHFFRLSTLPHDVKPGYVNIFHMEGGRLPSPPPEALPAPPQVPPGLQSLDIDLGHESSKPPIVPPTLAVSVSPDESQKEHITKISEPVLPPAIQNPILPQVNPLDMLASLMPSVTNSKASNYNYSVETETNQVPKPVSSAPVVPSSTLNNEINVTELLQKLIATGIVSNTKSKVETSPPLIKEKPMEVPTISPVDFTKPETLKTKQPGIIAAFYSGIQCSSCGVRFPPEQTMKYSQHLDWHFRQNRRDKDSSRMAQSRKWYYDISDWIQFEEIEDLEDRAQSWFESQAGQNSNGAETEEVPGEVPSVAAGESPEDAACEICRDKFEQFYNEEREEWHLRQAIRIEEKLYHPICYQDFKASLDTPIEVSLDETVVVLKDDDITTVEPPPTIVEEQIVDDDDDDDLEVIECEIIQPVFPIEDLTTSDCESVGDKNEEKLELMDENDTEEKKDKDSNSIVETEKIDEQMELGNENKGSDDQTEDLTTIDVEDVVKNIKQEPMDEEIPDSEGGMKKGTEEINIPEPVVDTTHAAVECSIDGNLQFDDSPQVAISAPPKIKINITKPLSTQPPVTTDLKEVENESSVTYPVNVFNTIVETQQPPPPGEEPGPLHLKPRLLGKKLQDLPALSKGSELSGLCSIM
uniref:CID domain-containing protein n=3 Tax=Clastoptera arizonana TaxID=38151 RepID=A0A1B6C345_9HEMI